jgi:hypothetical protein
MSQLTLWSYGFLVYATHGKTPDKRNARCRTIGTPTVPILPHECRLFILGEIIDNGGLKVEPLGDGYQGVFLPLTNCNVAFSASSNGTGAQTNNFDLIPDFQSLACGVNLDPGWRDRSILDVSIDLLGGTLSAEPDLYTNDYMWSWTDCDAQPIGPRRLTSLTKYVATWTDPVVMITASKARYGGSGTKGQVKLGGGDVTLAFLCAPPKGSGTPVRKPDVESAYLKLGIDTTRLEPDIDTVHFSSTLGLCRLPDVLPKLIEATPHKVEGNLSEPQLHPSVHKFLYAQQEFLYAGRENDLRGRPHCGGRQLEEKA